MPRTNKNIQEGTPAERRQADRLMRLALYAQGKDNVGHMVRRAKPKKDSISSPATEGLGHRAKTPTPMAEMDRRVPAGAEAQIAANKRKFDAQANSRDLPKVAAKVQAKQLTQTDYMNAYWGWVGIIQPEYELLEPWTIYDTESYFTRAVKRQKSLMFRNGFQVIGENETNRAYIEKRFQQISYFMGETLENFFKEILVQLLVCSNCVLIKIRDNDASGGVANPKNKNKTPVALYVLCPSHTIYPYLNGRGVVEKWRRFFADGRTFEDYAVEDIVHLHWDRKAGHLFGTPRTASVRDDILALRRLEENIELLMIMHMFPLFHIAVGTDDEPADYNIDGTSEIDFVRNDIEAMPKEGFLVTDARVKVSAVGARGEALDYDSIVKHYKTRIFTGLGVSGVDMGEGDTANRSTSETVSQNLKDYVKEDLDWFCGLIQMAMIREFFQEAPFDLSVQNAVADVHLAFPEIDVDGMIKMETHTMNQFNNHLITETEARKRMNRQPFSTEQRNNTHYKLHVLDLALKTAKAKNDGMLEAAQIQAANKATPGGKTTATKTQPTNQHGKNTDPHKARSSVDPQYFRPLYDMMMDLRREMDEKGNLTNDTWRLQVPKLIYAYFNEITGEGSGTLYTNQARMKLNQVRDGLVALVPETTDPDLLSVVVRDAQEELLEHGIEVIDDGQDKRTSTDNRKSEHGDSSQESALPKVGDPGPEGRDLRGEHQPE